MRASIFDIRHNFSFNASYELPIGPGKRFGSNLNGFAKHLLGGWQINSILGVAAGSPVTVTTGSNYSGSRDRRNPDRPSVRSGFSNNPSEGTSAGCGSFAAGTPLGTPNLYFDPCAFELPPPVNVNGVDLFTYGDVARSSVRGPGFANWDLGVFKNFTVSEDVQVQFRTEFFNLANRANFASPQLAVFTRSGGVRGSSGRISRTVTKSRNIQFALKILF